MALSFKDLVVGYWLLLFCVVCFAGCWFWVVVLGACCFDFLDCYLALNV